MKKRMFAFVAALTLAAMTSCANAKEQNTSDSKTPAESTESIVQSDENALYITVKQTGANPSDKSSYWKVENAEKAEQLAELISEIPDTETPTDGGEHYYGGYHHLIKFTYDGTDYETLTNPSESSNIRVNGAYYNVSDETLEQIMELSSAE